MGFEKAVNCVFHLNNTWQGPLNTSFLFIKIPRQNDYLTYLFKNNRNGSGAILSLAKGQHEIPPKPMVNSQWSHRHEQCWHFPCQEQFSAKGLPEQIRVKQPTANVVVTKPNWWNTWMLSSSWMPAQGMRQLKRDHFRNSIFVPSTRSELRFSPIPGNFLPYECISLEAEESFSKQAWAR